MNFPYPTEGPDLGRVPVSLDPVRALPATCSCWPDELYEDCDLHGRAAQPDVWPRLDAIDADIAQAVEAGDEDDGACPNCGRRSIVGKDTPADYCAACGLREVPDA